MWTDDGISVGEISSWFPLTLWKEMLLLWKAMWHISDVTHTRNLSSLQCGISAPHPATFTCFFSYQENQEGCQETQLHPGDLGGELVLVSGGSPSKRRTGQAQSQPQLLCAPHAPGFANVQQLSWASALLFSIQQDSPQPTKHMLSWAGCSNGSLHDSLKFPFLQVTSKNWVRSSRKG